MPPAPPKPAVEPPNRRKALIKCGVLLLVTIALYWFFKPRPPAEPAPPAPHSSIEPAAPAETPIAQAPSAEPVQRVANAGLPLVAPAPVPPKQKEAAKEPKKDKDKEKEKDRETKQNRKQIDEFFAAQGPMPTLLFRFIPEEWEYLKKEPRRYADAMMVDLGTEEVFKGVAVKCKGSAGSFQGPDGRPGLTISMNKYKGAERWRGFLKFHLNNAVQDNSWLHEQISCEMARAAGVPASRCAHVLLKWQGRDMGLYVFKEAFDVDFLSHFYKNPEGDLYDGGFVHEIDMNTEKDQGDPMQRENLRELIGACQEQNQEKRWARLEKILDVDEFLSFTAIESLTSHWDGYNFNRNNYRFYFDVDTGKAQFFLHGTDQTFGDANAAAVRDPGSMVGGAVMSNPAWKKAYRERVEKIYQEVLKPIDWPARVTFVGEKVKADLAKVNPQWAKDFEGRIAEARNRVAARITAVGKQLGDMPKPFKFDANGTAALPAGGEWQQQGAAAAIDTATRDGKTCLHIRADGESTASWRKPVTLPAGKFRVEVRMATAGVVGANVATGDGAGLRISGGSRTAPNAVTGDTGWQEIGFDLETPGGEIVLVAELRATKGEVWFDRDSFRLREVK